MLRSARPKRQAFGSSTIRTRVRALSPARLLFSRYVIWCREPFQGFGGCTAINSGLRSFNVCENGPLSIRRSARVFRPAANGACPKQRVDGEPERPSSARRPRRVRQRADTSRPRDPIARRRNVLDFGSAGPVPRPSGMSKRADTASVVDGRYFGMTVVRG